MTEIEALKSENETLKNIISQRDAQHSALSQTVNDILQANINLKAGNILFEKKVDALNQEIVSLITKLKELEPSLS